MISGEDLQRCPVPTATHSVCGHCLRCLGGWETLCKEQQNTGYSVNGSFAEYVLADPDYVGHLPANIDFALIAPILCAGVTVYKGLKMTEARPGSWVVISGIGGFGHLAVQYAKAMGLNGRYPQGFIRLSRSASAASR